MSGGKKKSAVERTLDAKDEKYDAAHIAHQRHIAELKSENARWKLLGREDLRLLVAQFGPVLWDVLILARALVDAADPTRGVPRQDTSRVTDPSSSRTEGSSTERNRDTLEAFRRRLGRLVADFVDSSGAELIDHRAFSAHTRHHLTEKTPSSECDYCRLDPRFKCQGVDENGERCDRVSVKGGYCRKHTEAA